MRPFLSSSVTSVFPNLFILATSAVDLDTDKAIQEIIRGPDFADVTLLTIACVPKFRYMRSWVLETHTQTLSTATV